MRMTGSRSHGETLSDEVLLKSKEAYDNLAVA
jgi:hypothetical protein